MTVFCPRDQAFDACIQDHQAARAKAFDAVWGSVDAIVHTLTNGPMAILFLACLICSLGFLVSAWKSRKEAIKKPVTSMVCAFLLVFFPVFSSIGAMGH
jgi:hypothetical protein